jgi:hypothetical protein
VKSRVEKKVQEATYIIISVKKTVQQARFGQETFIQGKQDTSINLDHTQDRSMTSY